VSDTLNNKVERWLAGRVAQAKRHGLVHNLTVPQLLLVGQSYENWCAYCWGSEYELFRRPATGYDLLIPVVRGGPVVQANAVPCCNDCKIAKKQFDAIRFCKLGGMKPVRLYEVIGNAATFNDGKLVIGILRELHDQRHQQGNTQR
jgi:hypothetical protein